MPSTTDPLIDPIVDVARELEELRLIRDVARQLVTATTAFEREACMSLLRQLVDPLTVAATKVCYALGKAMADVQAGDD